jgi:hypothetical protein
MKKKLGTGLSSGQKRNDGYIKPIVSEIFLSWLLAIQIPSSVSRDISIWYV